MTQIKVLTGGTTVPYKAKITGLIHRLLGQTYSLDERWIQITLSNKNTFVFGVYEGRDFVGVAVGNIKPHFTGMEFCIDDILIREDADDRGIYSTLIYELERYARNRGCSALILESAHEDAEHLCLSHGYEKRNATLKKVL